LTVSVALPALGESVTEGAVTRWLKQVGDRVEAGEPLLEVSTDKVDTEIPSPEGGVLPEITVTVEVGAALGTPVEAPTDPALTPVAPSTPRAQPAPPRPRIRTRHRSRPRPLARAGSRRSCRTTRRRPATGTQASSLRGRSRTVPMTRIRKAIGNNLTKALQELRLRGRAKDGFLTHERFKLSPLPFFIKAAAQALRAHPVVNARIDEAAGTIACFDTENIGIAVDTEAGLMTPVVKAAGDLTDAGPAAGTSLPTTWRERFTLSNAGSRGALFDTVIVPPKEAAIMGAGATVRQPAVVREGDDDIIGIRALVHLSWSYVHRPVDGADAAAT
jgi:2-oxoglutarate dehydrogenase E2 component (dihydrolipoamide succinyltransferase)